MKLKDLTNILKTLPEDSYINFVDMEGKNLFINYIDIKHNYNTKMVDTKITLSSK